MEWLFIFGLIAAVVGLFGRVRAVERRIEYLEGQQAGIFELMRSKTAAQAPVEQPVESIPEPAPASRVRVTVPKTVVIRGGADEALVSAAPELEPVASVLERAPFRLDIEDMFGRRLPIWAGGVALAVAGVFLVRYSIERGLVTPLLRVIMAFVFGVALLAGAEAAYRLRERVADPRVSQALAGAGLATLYAAFYLAGTQYGLIGQTLAFLGLATVTGGAIALSFRFGLPSAVLGLVGGFAAPVLVGGEEANLPLLSLYLGLVTAGLVMSGRRQQRPWMGMTALAGGLGWGAMLLLAGDFGVVEVLALGLYFVVLGAVLPALAGATPFEKPLRLAAALVASIQLALLVDQAGYSALVWGLYLLLGATLAFFGWRRAEIREGNAVAAAVAAILLAQWPDPAGPMFALVTAAIAAIFALVPLALVWRGADREVDHGQIVGVSAALAAVTYAIFGDAFADRIEVVLALATLAFAALPAAAAWVLRTRDSAAKLAAQLATAAALVFAALLMVTPVWAAPLAAGAVFAGLFGLLRGRSEQSLHAVLWGAMVVTGLALAAHSGLTGELERLFGEGEARSIVSLLRWLAFTAVLAALAWREHVGELRRFAEAAAVVALYGALAQVLPREALAWTAAVLAIALQHALRDRTAAALAAVAITLGWAIEPLGWWTYAGLASLAGEPVFVTDLPTIRNLATRVVPAALSLAIAAPPLPAGLRLRQPAGGLAVALGLVIAHVLFKQVFAIASEPRFETLGLAERTVWEALLLGAAWLAATGVAKIAPNRDIAIVLAGASLAHFALYTGLLHNPLWSAQALGSVPLANLGLAAYAVGIAAALSLRRWTRARFAPAWDGVVMVLASLALLTLLRQAFAGSLAAAVPMGQTEDLLRSLAGIVLALGFLWLGSRRGERSWRIGSLAIMLVAVAKVFLVDAAGLDGLMRVASFMALGFSLIGIGWVYTRQLGARVPALGI